VLNAPATIDADYRGEIGVLLINHGKRNRSFVRRGERIAQLVIARVAQAQFLPVRRTIANLARVGGWARPPELSKSAVDAVFRVMRVARRGSIPLLRYRRPLICRKRTSGSISLRRTNLRRCE